ncbi:hypothetical protein PsorP6_005204 [Peronosclerospora sorghi]|uniref:Uncharacterized protein n=1 Tax=Peronosclerospora sorghi TaxID=230839 RepID=A0ACC0W6S0_9STRA|nr:hypothetical protein PsorP6_005204 [Peronosclerospora sorghi]
MKEDDVQARILKYFSDFNAIEDDNGLQTVIGLERLSTQENEINGDDGLVCDDVRRNFGLNTIMETVDRLNKENQAKINGTSSAKKIYEDEVREEPESRVGKSKKSRKKKRTPKEKVYDDSRKSGKHSSILVHATLKKLVRLSTMKEVRLMERHCAYLPQLTKYTWK